MTFLDRRDAGERLARRLLSYRRERPVVLALPRGGVAVAREVAKELGAPLDVLVVRKIGVPFEPELAMGAIAEGMPPVVVRNEDVLLRARVTEAEFQDALDIAARELTRRKHLFRGDREPLGVEGRTVLLVDDADLLVEGEAATHLEALIKLGSRQPVRVVLACDTFTVTRSFAGWVAELRRTRRALVLQPAIANDGDAFGVRLRTRPGATFPPGRGFLIDRGTATLVQCARAE